MNKLIINANMYAKDTKLYVLSDADSSEVIAIIKARYEEDVKPSVIQALREHHDEEHLDVYNVQVFDNHNTKFSADGVDRDDDEILIDRNYNLIARPMYE